MVMRSITPALVVGSRVGHTQRKRRSTLATGTKVGPLLAVAGAALTLSLTAERVAAEATLAVGGNHACIISTTGGVKVR